MSNDECAACTNRSHEAPIPPEQSFPLRVLLGCLNEKEETGPLCVNSEGVLGGAFLEITDSPIDTLKILDFASSETCGAISTFIGVTRNHHCGRRVERLEYEAFSTMAIKQLKHIVGSIFSKFPQVHRVVVSHRIGIVPVKEASVFIAVTSEHRAASLQAVAHAIDTLKSRVPIWKREIYVDEGESWKQNQEAFVA